MKPFYAYAVFMGPAQYCWHVRLSVTLLTLALGTVAFGQDSKPQKPASQTPVASQPPPSQPALVEAPPSIQPTLPADGFVGIPSLMQPPPPPPEQVRGVKSASEAIRAILGLVVIFGLAYLAGQPRVQKLERRLRIAQVVTTGFPFVLLGLVSRHVGILSENVLWEIRPLMALGLGWIGFNIGFRFNSKLVDSLSPAATRISTLTGAVPFATILAGCAVALVLIEHFPADAIFLRDAMILATAGAMTAFSAPRLLEARGASGEAVNRIRSVVELDQLAGVFGLMLLAAYFRPQGALVSWQLPGTAWLFMTLGMGVTVGGVIYAALGRIRGGPEFGLLVLGSVCFAGGMASFLRLSPLVVCFIVGIIVVNLPGGQKDQIRAALKSMERPIYLLFLLVAGSLWDVSQWQGWALMVLFVLTRLLGKWLAVLASGRLHPKKKIPIELAPEERRSLIFAPLGALSIAIVVNAQDLYPNATVSWIVTAVIGGAVLTEIMVQATSRNAAITEHEPWEVS